jgi:hypothetical protein
MAPAAHTRSRSVGPIVDGSASPFSEASVTDFEGGGGGGLLARAARGRA